ncbi:unnamed protein product [Phaeothamnion confervicola]
MVGYAAFDPLHLSTPETLPRLRDSELRHGRLAMVALGGWPVSELALAVLTRVIPPDRVCTGTGCAIDDALASHALPLSAIGGFSIAYWGSALLLAAAGEVAIERRAKKANEAGEAYEAGDAGLDPFNLASRQTRALEIWHGRLAMAGFLLHYAAVFAQKGGVVFAHQLWGQVCVLNVTLRALSGEAPGGLICYPRPEAALDTTLSWEILWRVMTGYFKEPYY